MKKFGDQLRERRVAAGRGLREVAEYLGVSHVYVGEVEREHPGRSAEEALGQAP